MTQTDYKKPEVLKRLYHGQKLTMNEIGARFDVVQDTIKYWMDEHGIERRPKSEAHRMRHAKNDAPYKDRDNLYEKYVTNDKTTYELAIRWGCDPKTIGNWLDRHGIEKRQTGDWQGQNYVSLWHTNQGYVYWKDHTKPSRGKSFPVHRLLAIAKFGIDAVKGNHVHHKNGVKWDNRPENIDLISPSNHARLHYKNGDLQLEHGGIQELKSEVQK